MRQRAIDRPFPPGYTWYIQGGAKRVTTIQKWGNSQGLRLSKELLGDAHIAVGDQVEVMLKDGVIVIAAAKRLRGRHSLQELVSQIPENYRAEEIDWGGPVGREEW